EPYIKVFARRIGDGNAKIRLVARDVPVRQIGFAVVAAGTEPFACLGQYFGLEALVAAGIAARGPLLKEFYTARIRKLKEEMLGRFEYRRGLGECGVGLDKLGGRVDGPAGFAGISVLV